MKFSTLFLKRMLPVGLAFGTAWAARGQIGHEYGATWAAAIGILALIVFSGRKDWFNRLPVIVALGAIAWGAGGMISYGKIVGYAHAADYANTAYGLGMLVIIGALYGFMGGGVTALSLSSSPDKKIDWAALFTRMFAGGFLFWGFFIYQLEWLMTPPRSELWAACMGASLALGWYLYRNGFSNALRTAFFSALGAGFGFGFGAFLQRMGWASGISFNWWNVMEYSIGFFGGLGMAYGIFSTGGWPKTTAIHKASNVAGWLFLVVLLPMINLIEGATDKRLAATGKDIRVADPDAFADNWRLFLWIFSAALMIVLTYYYKPAATQGASRKKAGYFTLLYLAWYIVLSNVVSAIWLTPKFSSQHLYWVNLAVIALFLRRLPEPIDPATKVLRPATMLKWWVAVILVVLLLSCVAVSLNYIHPNAQLRFE
ncbi:MAG: hypothetical protein M9933_10155 [Chitinophagaceae bacterium]|nr:hypothetical protein [Chitinophagaceae bacterium]